VENCSRDALKYPTTNKTKKHQAAAAILLHLVVPHQPQQNRSIPLDSHPCRTSVERLPTTSMQIQVNTDNHITGREELATQVESIVQQHLRRFSGQITRVEVHLGDTNSHKGGSNDMRCMMEARLEGRPPTAATEQAATLMQAVRGAAHKLEAALDTPLGKLRKY
jgi:hypothetical protein